MAWGKSRVFTLYKHNWIILINRVLFVVIVVVFNLIFSLFLFLFISHYFKKTVHGPGPCMTGGPRTWSMKVVHGPLVHVLSSPEKNYYLGRFLRSCLEPPAGFANKERSSTDSSIAVVNGYIACILVACDLYSSCRINKRQLSIGEWLGEWLHNHEGTTLVFFRSWSRYFSSMYFHVFFDKLSNKLLWLFCLFVIFPMKLHFLVF